MVAPFHLEPARRRRPTPPPRPSLHRSGHRAVGSAVSSAHPKCPPSRPPFPSCRLWPPCSRSWSGRPRRSPNRPFLRVLIPFASPPLGWPRPRPPAPPVATEVVPDVIFTPLVEPASSVNWPALPVPRRERRSRTGPSPKTRRRPTLSLPALRLPRLRFSATDSPSLPWSVAARHPVAAVPRTPPCPMPSSRPPCGPRRCWSRAQRRRCRGRRSGSLRSPRPPSASTSGLRSRARRRSRSRA